MERLSMRKIREVLRLRYAAGLSTRQVAASVQLAHSTVVEYARRFAAAGLSWPLPAALSDTELERRLFPPPPTVPVDTRPVPDWAEMHQELRRPGVTLQLLWEEYQAAHPQGFRLQLVLRALSRLGRQARPGDASDPPRRREAVRRLRRPDGRR